MASRMFQFERETKGTWRFKEEPIGDQPPLIGTLYIRKDGVEFQTRPSRLAVTVTVTEVPAT